jgi:hypothetical protein
MASIYFLSKRMPLGNPNGPCAIDKEIVLDAEHPVGREAVQLTLGLRAAVNRDW